MRTLSIDQEIEAKNTRLGNKCDGYSWLDKYVAQQAANYNMSAQRFKDFMSSCAEYQEQLDTTFSI